MGGVLTYLPFEFLGKSLMMKSYVGNRAVLRMLRARANRRRLEASKLMQPRILFQFSTEIIERFLFKTLLRIFF